MVRHHARQTAHQALFGHSGKSDIKILRTFHLVRLKGHSNGTGRSVRVSQSERVRRIGAIPQHARPGEIQDLLEKLQPFCRQFPNENRASSNVPARVSKTRDQPSATGWIAVGMTIGIVVVAFLAARAAGVVVVIIRSALVEPYRLQTPGTSLACPPHTGVQ